MSSLFESLILQSGIFCFITLLIYQAFSWLQQKTGKIWLNPMLLSILVLIAILLTLDITYSTYQQATLYLSKLLEPAVVALGYPLFQQLRAMKAQWKKIFSLLTLAAFLAISTSYILTMVVTQQLPVSVSLALKSITTPIGIALTEQLHGNSSITAFAIIIAGLVGAIFGIKWLTFINVTSPKAQGLAIGCASHALGTATISQISYVHAAYSSLALIVSATVTAIIAPSLIGHIQSVF